MKKKRAFGVFPDKKRIACLLFLVFLLFSMRAYCATEEEVDAAGGLLGAVFGMVDDIFGLSGLADLKELLVIEFGSGSLRAGGITFLGLPAVITSMHRIFQNLGVMMLIVFFGVGLLEGFSLQQMYVEKLVRQFVFLCIGIVLIAHSMEFVYGVGNVFSALIGAIVENADASRADMAGDILALKMAIYDDCNASTGSGLKAVLSDSVSNLAASVGYLVQLFIPSLIGRLSNVAVFVMCWSRFIELTLLAVASPLMVCDIATGDGRNTGAYRGAKHVLALGLSGALMMLAVFICQQLEYGILSANTLDSARFLPCVWKEAVVAVVQVGVVSRAPVMARQMLGIG